MDRQTETGLFIKRKLLNIKIQTEPKLYDHIIMPDLDDELQEVFNAYIPNGVLAEYNGPST